MDNYGGSADQLVIMQIVTYKFHFLSIFSLKIGPTTRFTHLKIILLQCFQFQQNKLYPNRP